MDVERHHAAAARPRIGDDGVEQRDRIASPDSATAYGPERRVRAVERGGDRRCDAHRRQGETISLNLP